MMPQTVGVIGNGTVGSFLTKIFGDAGISTVLYGKYQALHASNSRRDQINQCDFVFIAVPTPTISTGCDLSAVEESVSWVTPPMCIKSTILPGTTDRLVALTGKEIVFSPEYIGEIPFHRYRHRGPEEVAVIGGRRDTALKFLTLYRDSFGLDPRFVADAITVELAKYMGSCFFATKIAFVTQFYLLARQFDADFHQMREVCGAGSRVGHSHSAVIHDLGFGDRCLPKDLDAIIEASQFHGSAPLLEAIAAFNRMVRAANHPDDRTLAS